MQPSQVRSDRADVAQTLREIGRIVTRAGGGLHPAAALLCEADQLGIVCQPGHEGQTLASVPSELLPDGEGLGIDDSGIGFFRTPEADDCTTEQRDMLDLLAALFNQTGKAEAFTACAPARLLASSPDLQRALNSVRPGYAVDSWDATKAFLGSRVLARRAGHEHDATGSQPTRRVLMPIIDMLDHHPRGAPYGGDTRTLRVKVRTAGNQLCFARYNTPIDPLSLALKFAYVDHNADEAVSIPVTVEVASLGEMAILGRNRPRLSNAHPPTIHDDEDRVLLSHVLFSSSRPVSTQQTLMMAVTSLLARRGVRGADPGAVTTELYEAVAHANLTALSHLLEQVEAGPRRDDPARDVLAGGIRQQMQVIASASDRVISLPLSAPSSRVPTDA